jgi:signal transduction histidine kinase
MANLPQFEFEEMVKQYITFEINIIDTGTGISKDGLSKLFLNFSKLAENADQNPTGTGLGLSICKQIIEQMGGSVSCSSELNVGTEFKIKLSCPSFTSHYEPIVSDKLNYTFMEKPYGV